MTELGEQELGEQLVEAAQILLYRRGTTPRCWLQSAPKARGDELMLNHVNFARWSTPQQATFRTEVLWPLPPLSTVDPRSEPEGALPPVGTGDSLNAGWDGPPSWNVSAAAMTGDIVLWSSWLRRRAPNTGGDHPHPQIIDEIHAHREYQSLRSRRSVNQPSRNEGSMDGSGKKMYWSQASTDNERRKSR
jgi:hypothetical protein